MLVVGYLYFVLGVGNEGQVTVTGSRHWSDGWLLSREKFQTKRHFNIVTFLRLLMTSTEICPSYIKNKVL